MAKIDWKSESFNPTLVRLRRFSIPWSRPVARGFNPTLVRLRLSMRFYNLGRPTQVSIPRWFD